MNKLDKLDKLSNVTNRSYGQTKFLFDLLDRNFKKLVLLEQKIKNNLLFYCPNDKEECEKVLAMNDESGWAYSDKKYSKLDDFLPSQLGKECTYKLTGHKGRLVSELPYDKSFPAQWGVYWFDGKEGNEHATRNKTIGVLQFWNDKDKVDLQR